MVSANPGFSKLGYAHVSSDDFLFLFFFFFHPRRNKVREFFISCGLYPA